MSNSLPSSATAEGQLGVACSIYRRNVPRVCVRKNILLSCSSHDAECYRFQFNVQPPFIRQEVVDGNAESVADTDAFPTIAGSQ